MARPDFLMLGLLVHKNVLTYDQALALSERYAKKSYDNPVPIDLDAGLDIAIDAMAEGDDDEAIKEIFERSACACGESCAGCGGPVGGGEISEADFDGALTLWFGLNPLLRTALLAQL